MELNVHQRRAKEADVNHFPNFKTEVSHNGRPFSIHFAALFSARTDATTLVLLHGWPGSFLEFLPMLDLLAQKYTPDTLPYHVIVPSLPGYAFSSRQSKDADFTLQEASTLVNDAVVGLGLGKEYFVQGGDIGSYVSRMLAVKYAHVKAAHRQLLVLSARPSKLTREPWQSTFASTARRPQVLTRPA